MNKLKQTLHIGLWAVTATLFVAFSTGCESVQDVVYDEQITETTGTLPADAVKIDGDYYDVATLEPGTYSPQQVIPAGTEVTKQTVELEPKSHIEATIAAGTSLLTPYGGIAGILAAAGLSFFARIQKKKLTLAEKGEIALVQGIDAFRDVLDQTPQGAVIDEKLTELLKERQQTLGIHDEVRNLVRRWETPTKKPLVLK